MRWVRDSFVLTDEPTESLVADTFRLLQTTYWSHKRPMEVVGRMIENSLCFALFSEEQQVGFARVITDYATTSWLADVVISESLQGQGLGSWVMQCVLEHPTIADTQFVLQTGTAHEFYKQLGFEKSEALMSTPVDYL